MTSRSARFSIGRRPRERAYAALWLVAVAVACSSAATTTVPPFDGNIPLGNWGGENAGMIVSDTAMHLHIGCTYGDASGRVPVGSGGQFDVAGSYMLRAYPIAVGPTVPARFTGRLDGDKVTITATIDDTVQQKTVVLGPVTVTYGADAKLGPCPICRRPIITKTSPASAGRVREAVRHAAAWIEKFDPRRAR
ncbi:MAG TPA: hypothetical protein VL524_04045 [Gemmatimonadaceae bacterium]|jgi:hypothetical protein|nr:hypothetical protein [Gemmatimonadaceae bacterium]